MGVVRPKRWATRYYLPTLGKQLLKFHHTGNSCIYNKTNYLTPRDWYIEMHKNTSLTYRFFCNIFIASILHFAILPIAAMSIVIIITLCRSGVQPEAENAKILAAVVHILGLVCGLVLINTKINKWDKEEANKSHNKIEQPKMEIDN